MRLDGGVTPSGTNDADSYLPAFFRSEYPELVEYLDLYIDSLYKSSLTPDQVRHLLEDESWWVGSTENYKSPESRQLAKIKALNEYRLKNFGVQTKTVDLLDNKTLKRKENILTSLDELFLLSSDGRRMKAKDEENHPLKQWLLEKNLVEISQSLDTDNVPLDLINLIKLSRHLFKIRGTTECAKLFLSSMYSGDVYITLPRNKIATLDDNFTLDLDVKLRDDFVYDEFTYVINLVSSEYFNIGPKYFDMYKRLFHASGFRCILRVYTTEEWLLVQGNYLNQPELIKVWEQFFNNEFASIMRGL